MKFEMAYRSTKECIEDLEKAGQLLRISQEVDPHLEMAEIQRRIYLKQGPALLFENVKNIRLWRPRRLDPSSFSFFLSCR